VSILHEAMTALLSCITAYKPGTKEILWQNEYGSDITIEVIDTKTESYVIRRYYENGQPYYEHNYISGLKHGVSKAWHNNGQISCEHNYQDGLKYGVSKDWHNNGQLYSMHNYQHGKLHGLCEDWHDNGKPWCKHTYISGVRQ